MSGAGAAATELWPFAVYAAAVLLAAAGMLGASHLLGERSRGGAGGEPYECGMPPTGSARLHRSAKFYLVAVFFVIFDIEAVFIFAWAVAVRETGWRGYGAMLVFVGVILAALAYLWRVGALDWGPARGEGGEG